MKKNYNFTPSSRIWTSDLWITNLLYYSPPLYQLSYGRFDDHEWHFTLCELLVHNAFCEKTKLHFIPSSRIWTSDLWITNLLYYSPPLYQLSYRRFNECEWYFISCELLVHNAFVKKKKKPQSFGPDLNQRPIDYKLALLQSTALPTELSKVWRSWVTFHFMWIVSP